MDPRHFPGGSGYIGGMDTKIIKGRQCDACAKHYGDTLGCDGGMPVNSPHAAQRNAARAEERRRRYEARRPKHPTEMAAYWRRLARDERAFAKEHGQTAESALLHRKNAVEYDERAAKIEAAERSTCAECGAILETGETEFCAPCATGDGVEIRGNARGAL